MYFLGMAHDMLRRIEDLYRELPGVACEGCGECCVSPACTLAEFVYLMKGAGEQLPAGIFRERVLSTPEEHPSYENNLKCFFLTGNSCCVHSARTGACRLFGLPALRELGIRDMVYCARGIKATGDNVDAAWIREWLERLVQVDAALYAYGEEPYFVTGFNVHCWLDIYFDESIDAGVFSDLRRLLRDHLDLGFLEGTYVPQTGLKEKVDKISVLSAMQGMADPETITRLLVSIRDDYPRTGTYYVQEALALLAALGNGP
ncbi:MAG: hypothetical protein GF418_15895 [Chitinivibrionales bacterium]|nr:hypothetical protein [Chitinivibrionales bacterium]MBD3397103.1 hypothetical protein [Chitinivibrionales bacterium]